MARLNASPPASPAPRFATPPFPLFSGSVFCCYSVKRSFAGQTGHLSDNRVFDGLSDIKIDGRNDEVVCLHEMHIRDKPKTYTERTLILLTPEQKADLYKRARNEGVHVSDYIRSVLFPSTESQGLAERLSDLERRVAALEQAMQTPTH